MRPTPVWQAAFEDGTVIKAGILRGRIVVWGASTLHVAELEFWVGERENYTWPEAMVFNTGAAWALPYTMQRVFPQATITLVDGTPDPLPPALAVPAPIPGEPESRFRHLRAVPDLT
jgi:hypothetical protein